MKRQLCVLRNWLRRTIFRLGETYFRLHITPVHFYSPLPNVSELKPEHFSKVNDCVGLDFHVDDQLRRSSQVFRKYVPEYSPPPNPGLSRVDALVLYAMLRDRKPAFVIEIGSGESTKISLAALRKNEEEGNPYRMVAIEPFPRRFLRDLKGNFELIEKKVQDVGAEFLSQADILFIDSSHVSKIGSDVNYEILDIVPRLKVGALAHWHDIMIPGEYPQTWLEHGNMFWNESYMVHAFMLYNHAFRIIWASKYMQLNYPDHLRETFPYFASDDPDQQLSSFWVERVT